MVIEYDIRASVAKNRLYISIKGFMSEEDAEIIANKAIEETRKLKSGFGVINDIRDLKPATPRAAQIYARQLEVAKEIGIGRVVRVVGDQMITKLQLSRTLKDTLGIVAETAKTLEEAERMLDNP